MTEDTIKTMLIKAGYIDDTYQSSFHVDNPNFIDFWSNDSSIGYTYDVEYEEFISWDGPVVARLPEIIFKSELKDLLDE